MASYKVLLVGDSGVGKTSLIKRKRSNVFEKQYNSTYGCEPHTFTFNTNKGLKTMDIWDISGQEKYSGVNDAYYTFASGAIIMFDHTNNITLKSVRSWIKNMPSGIPIILCCNKTDVDRSLYKRSSSYKSFIPDEYLCVDISVKNNDGCDLLFEQMLTKLVKKDVKIIDNI